MNGDALLKASLVSRGNFVYLNVGRSFVYETMVSSTQRILFIFTLRGYWLQLVCNLTGGTEVTISLFIGILGLLITIKFLACLIIQSDHLLPSFERAMH